MNMNLPFEAHRALFYNISHKKKVHRLVSQIFTTDFALSYPLFFYIVTRFLRSYRFYIHNAEFNGNNDGAWVYALFVMTNNVRVYTANVGVDSVHFFFIMIQAHQPRVWKLYQSNVYNWLWPRQNIFPRSCYLYLDKDISFFSY